MSDNHGIGNGPAGHSPTSFRRVRLEVRPDGSLKAWVQDVREEILPDPCEPDEPPVPFRTISEAPLGVFPPGSSIALCPPACDGGRVGEVPIPEHWGLDYDGGRLLRAARPYDGQADDHDMTLSDGADGR